MKSASNLESKKKINKTLNNTMRKRKWKKEKVIAKRYSRKKVTCPFTQIQFT
jgi:hypothetical protein